MSDRNSNDAPSSDECPERDSDGYCNCRKVNHKRIMPPRLRN